MILRPRRLLSALLLGLAACGSTAPAGPATGLAYADPPGPGWRLVRDPASTPTRLVLDLVGPAGLLTRGVGFNLKGGPGVRFAAFEDGLPIRTTGVYQLEAGGPDPTEPVALAGGVKPGNLLTVGVFQKSRAHGAKDSGVALCQIALTLDPAAPAPLAGQPLGLEVVKAGAIPADIGAETDPALVLDKKLHLLDLSVAVGALTAR